ncbi:MAG: acyl-CoA thioesterase [Candidatus Omnitrophica bacterium]|nr:acyl-CoA thioesterase [Candidatus Omnitrophota bacterium]MBU1852359.1 acyl-CoA thioesterase [Candidatus Omnitrophota bacterium]
MPNKKFIYEHTVFFNETNAMGGVVYYSNYVKWQGITREDYFIKTVPEWQLIMQEVANGKVNMITVEEHSHFFKHAFFGDKITIELHTEDIKQYCFNMVFVMRNIEKDDILYKGWQKLTFDDFKGNFVPIPPPMLKSVLDHATKEEHDRYKKRYMEK